MPEPPRAADIAIEPASANLASLGERATFTGTITDQYGAAFPGTVDVVECSDEGVFTVDPKTASSRRSATARAR